MKGLKFCRSSVFLSDDLSKYNETKAKLDRNGIFYKTKISNDDKTMFLSGRGSYRSFGGNFSNCGIRASLYEILVRKEDCELAKKVINGGYKA